jgi:replication initiator protein A (repA) N-terminus
MYFCGLVKLHLFSRGHEMQYDYFYGAQAEQFSFYRIPKALFTDAQFKDLSTDAKVLYGILLDRMSLSLKNHWLDEQNRVYIIFTLEEIMESLNCANQKATRLMVELEKKVGLIERKRQGLGKPCLIYVKSFVTPK